MKNKEVTARAIELLKENGVDFHTESVTELGMDIVTVTHGDVELQIYVGNDVKVKNGLSLLNDIACMYLGDNDMIQGIKTVAGTYYLADDDTTSECGLSNRRIVEKDYMLKAVCNFHSDAEIFNKIII